MSLTLTDLFCGAGGSAQGAHVVPGIELRLAANHWQLAVDSHAENFPDADHLTGSESPRLHGLTCDNESCAPVRSLAIGAIRGRTAWTAGSSFRPQRHTAATTRRRSGPGARSATPPTGASGTTGTRKPVAYRSDGRPATSAARPRRSLVAARFGASTPTTTTVPVEPGAASSAPAATPGSACSATTPRGSVPQPPTSKLPQGSPFPDPGASPRHVVMFSSGAGSWAAARRVADEHGTDGLVLLFADVLGEDEDNYRFLHEAAADIGGELVILTEGRTIWDVFKDNRFLGNTRLANCSKFLKQQPAREWLDAHCDPATTTVYVGIDWTEMHRLPAIERSYQPYAAKAPLTEAPYLHRDQVLAQLRRRGIEPPRLYDMGFAHANCGGGCVRAGQGQFATLLKQMPERFAEWERNEQELREYLGKDVAILRDRRGGQLVPLTLTRLRERAESRPEQIDLFDVGGCGCFVDEDGAA